MRSTLSIFAFVTADHEPIPWSFNRTIVGTIAHIVSMSLAAHLVSASLRLVAAWGGGVPVAKSPSFRSLTDLSAATTCFAS